jgi:hypothetical protein
MKAVFKLFIFASCVILTFIAAAGQAALDMDRFDEFIGTFSAVGGDVKKHVDAAQPRGGFEPIPLIESRTAQTDTAGVANQTPSNPRDVSPPPDGKAVPVKLSAGGPAVRPANAVYTSGEESAFRGFFSSDDDFLYADSDPYKPEGQGPGGETGPGKIVYTADPPDGDTGPATAEAPAAQVPEPGTMTLLGLAVAGAAAMRKKLTK